MAKQHDTPARNFTYAFVADLHDFEVVLVGTDMAALGKAWARLGGHPDKMNPKLVQRVELSLDLNLAPP